MGGTGLTSQQQSNAAIQNQVNFRAQAALQQILGDNIDIFSLSNRSSLYTSKAAKQTAIIEALGLKSQLDLNLTSTFANAVADTANLAARQALGLASKSQEMALFLSQYREKTLNLLISIQEGRDSNTWSRIKRMAGPQGFKF